MTNYSLKDLRALDALLQERHVSQAALRLGVSQPAMSLQLARLRDLFGDPLLVRRGGRLAPTETALALEGRLRALIREMEDLLEHPARFDAAASRRNFTLILTDYIDAIIVPALHRRMRDVAPGITLRIIGPDPVRLGDVFGAGRVDLTVSYFPDAPRDLVSRRVFSDRLVCLARRDHPAAGARLSVEGYCALNHVAIEPAQATMYRALLDEALEARGLTRRLALSKPDFVGVPFLLERSDLVATMPERLARLFAGRFDLAVFDLPLELPPLDIRMMWHKSTQDSAPHKWLRDQVMAVCRETAAAIVPPPGRF